LQHWEVIVVGAGPCGLSCAASFTSVGLSTLVLEKGCLVDSIYRFPDGMRFFSGPEGLQIGKRSLSCAGEHPTRAEALAYYRQIIFDLRLKVRISTPVVRIDGTDEDFRVHTPSGELTCLSQLGSSAAGKPFRISGGVQKVSTTKWVCVLGESSWSHQAVRSFAMRS